MAVRIDKASLELNESIYHLEGQFWKQTYNNLVLQLLAIEKDDKITPQKSILRFRKEVFQLAKKNGLTVMTSSMSGRKLLFLSPMSINICIDKVKGEINVATPHMNTMHFMYNEYESALAWIQNYINVDVRPLKIQKKLLEEKYYLNTKAAEIIQSSINSLTEVILEKKGWRYELNQHFLRSVIYIKTDANQIYRIEVCHKAFGQDSSLLLNQLSNPHEEFIEDRIHCCLIKDAISFLD